MLSWQASSLAVVVLLHGPLLTHISCGSIGNTADILYRGVEPALRSEYGRADGKFRCLRSGEVISDSQVNDQYCDCRDGSDEPGTSACSNGQFYCWNKGHKPRILNSSFVDDDICDESPHKCFDTCEEAGALEKAALRRKAKAFKVGLKLRTEYVTKAVGKPQRWEKDLENRRREEQALRREVNILRGKKERIEKLEAERLEAEALSRRSNGEAVIDPAEAESTHQHQSECTDKASGAQTSTTGVSSQGQDLRPAEKSAAELNEEYAIEYLAKSRKEVDPGEGLSEEEQAKRKQERLEEEGRKIAAQWTSDPDAAAVDNLPDASLGKPDTSDLGLESEQQDGLVIAGEETATGLVAWMKRLFKSALWERWEGSSDVKAAHSLSVNKLSETTKQRKDLEKKLKLDFGPENVFLTLADRCVSVEVEKYVYEVCFFGAAAQKDGGMSTSLGSFARFENNFSTMVYEGGQGCWSGPPRSIRVGLECGSEEELSGVNELERCGYTARLATPAVCTVEGYQAVLNELESIEEQMAVNSEL